MEELKVKYTGKIKEVEIGTGDKKIKVGGENCFNFHNFEGEIPHLPVISFEVPDIKPNDWPESCIEPFEKIVNNVDVPLFFWGVDNEEKDVEILRMVAEVCEGKNVAIGPCIDKNYKQIGAAAIGYKHVVIASTPIDVNLAKQLNILLMELGVPEEKIIIDPTTGGLGYGIEYTYSVMERIRIAGLLQQDDKLAFPMICYLSKEVWKTKEVTIPESLEPNLGKIKERGITMEGITATLLALSGADILVIRHPETVSLINELIEEMK